MIEIPLASRKYPGHVALIDDADLGLVQPYTWCPLVGPKRRTLYATASRKDGTGSHILMHNLIMGQVGIDHRDGDGLNNQRFNLRVATQGQNGANQAPQCGTSRFKGVSYYRGRWRAQITVNRRNRHLGAYATEEHAARAYDAAAREAWGPYARVNFPC
jgi:hypothetical protein